jgi:RimJ/RimL family protein N-acetyltransferase
MSVIIETPRLVLRRHRASDARSLVAGLNNFNVSQWTARIPFPYTDQDAAAFLGLVLASGADMLRLAITLDGALIGGIGCERTPDGSAAELGYWLAEPWWACGFGREAARAVTDYMFEATDCALLVAGYRHGNEASRRILAGLGFVTTGETMMFSRAVGSETPTTRMALSRRDWAEAKGRPS